MIILPKQRLLVVATGVGTSATQLGALIWTSIDPPFVWYSNPFTASDLANLPNDEFLIVDQSRNLLRRARISKPATVFGAGGGVPFITFGTTVAWGKPPASWTPIRIGSCAEDPRYAYCIGSSQNPGEDPAFFAIRSTDGGQNWFECGQNVPNRIVGDTFAKNIGALDSGPKSRYSVAVHPKLHDVVALGCKAVLLSNNGGQSWFAIDSGNVSPQMVPWHDDIHELKFDDNLALYIPSDGGILSIPCNLEVISPLRIPEPPLVNGQPEIINFPTDDSRNRTLPILLFLDGTTRSRQMMGNLALDSNGNIAAGTVDNGNLWLNPKGFWQPIDYGDGGFVALSSQFAGTFAVHARAGGNSLPANCAELENGLWNDLGVTPIQVNQNVSDATGLQPGKAVFPQGTMRPVPPNLLSYGPWPVIALGSAGDNNIYGAVVMSYTIPSFPPAPPQNFNSPIWIRLGAVPAGENISALEPYDGNLILVGTNSGRMFQFPMNGPSKEILFNQDVQGPIVGIASNGKTMICCKGSSPQYLFEGQLNAIFQYYHGGVGLTLLPVTSFPANDGTRIFRAFAANRLASSTGIAFAVIANEHEIWVSRSSYAITWDRLEAGLPAAVRAADLSFSATGELFLSTHGRSLWRLPA